MFPQSELDNYKLQVELLQEKLQRSEISRQQLEHKLEKLLQKRDEHEKIARSKAKQKYLQFLEEQQRRNERNKQLVQMLERIEQQTEIMNARSERLKMMKLQYEMYFAKLVHSQTRRCIQNSVAPVVPPMMATTSVQPLAQSTINGIQQTVVEGYNYMPNANTPMTTATYQYYVPIPTYEKDQYINRQQQSMNVVDATMQIPSLANLQRQERQNVKMDLRNVKQVPAERYETYNEINENNIENLPHDKLNENDMELNHLPKVEYNTNRNFEPASTHLLTKDKELADSPKLALTTSSTFEQVPNVKMMSQKPIINNSEKYLHNIDPTNRNNLVKSSLPNEENLQPMKRLSSSIDPIQKPIIINTVNNQRREDIENSTNIIDKTLNEIQIGDKMTAKSIEEPKTSYAEISQIITPKSTISTNNMKPETEETLNLPNEPLNNKKPETNASSTPMTIENIENAIYGELVSPLETEQEQKQEPTSVVPKLLENLVTEPETIEIENNPSSEANSESKLDSNLINNNNETVNELTENSNNETIEPNVAYEEYSNPQQNEPSINTDTVADYQTYENIDANTVNENQQDQQYDYSNYDPTQYSYPGYIYDETTGEYKPDPNAPAEQYATDQQYTAEGYDQQYQQQNTYDYDQTYVQEPASNLETNTYNNYDPALQENISDIPSTDINLDQQNNPQQIQLAELDSQQQQKQPLEQIVENTPEDITQHPAKVIKPTSILSTADKNESQKKKKRVNFVDSSEADESVTDKEVVTKPKPATTGGSSESDFDFSSSNEGETKTT